MESTTHSFMLSTTTSQDSNASGQHSTSSLHADGESVDDGEKPNVSRDGLDAVKLKLQLIDDLASKCLIEETDRLRDLKEGPHMEGRISLRELHTKLKAKDKRIEALVSTCDRLREMDKNKSAHVRRVEDIISTNESAATESIFLKNEINGLKAKLQSLHTSVSDSFVLEKLNLAYQDLIAIYDLRADIAMLLEQLHHDMLSPTLQKNIVRLIRQKELALHSKITNK